MTQKRGVTTLNRNLYFTGLRDVDMSKVSTSIAAIMAYDPATDTVEGQDVLTFLQPILDPVYLDHTEGATKCFAITMAIVL